MKKGLRWSQRAVYLHKFIKRFRNCLNLKIHFYEYIFTELLQYRLSRGTLGRREILHQQFYRSNPATQTEYVCVHMYLILIIFRRK